MKKIPLILVACLCAWIAKAQTTPNLFKQVDREQMNHWVDSVFDSMSEEERIGQLFMVIADPKSDTRNIQKLTRYIQELKIGGILFHKGNPETQAEVTNRMQKIARVPLLIALDGEWGLSMRLNGTTRFPKNMMLGAIEDNGLIEQYGAEVGRQCQEMGIHINFAPDMDVNSNKDNPVIGLRSFSEEASAVADKGIAYARGIESTGIISVAKHFPGHGDTSDDSHKTLPVIRHDRARLDSVELLPFRRYIEAGFGGVMTAHLQVPALDKARRPASFSRAVVTDLLTREFGFEGLRFTDALAMKGASTRRADNPSVMALKAGNDIVLAPSAPISDFNAVKEALAEGLLSHEEMEAKCLKVLRYKYLAGLNHYKPIDLKGLSKRLNSPHAEWLAAKLNAEAITLLKNESATLPLKELDKKKIAVLSIGSDKGNEFQTMLSRYDSVAYFSIGRNSSAAQIQQTYKKLQKYDVIICSVHTVRIPEHPALRQLAEKKELIYTFFTLPYFCKEYKRSIMHAKAVVMAYEATPLAQQYAAQLLFGGIGAKGKLPVSIPNLYYAGSGVFTKQSRLGYHQPEEVGLDAERLEEVRRIAQEGLEQKAYPGCQVLVAKDGQIVFNECFGYYDFNHSQAVQENSVYDLASSSKATGTLLTVMKAYDEHLFTLNHKVSEFIPELQKTDKQDLTIKELLYHQSGLVPTILFYKKALAKTAKGKPLAFNPELVSTEAKEGFKNEIARGLYLNDCFRDSIIQGIKESKLGKRGAYNYSCVNFILLQHITERLFHEPMDRLLDRRFFLRLGAYHTTYNPLHKMDSSWIVPTEQDDYLRHQLLRGYVHDESAAFQGGVSGNAGLFSNANDLAKVLQLYLNQGNYGGERYLSPETMRLFTQSKSPTCRRGLGFDKPVPGNPKASPCGSLAPGSVYGHTGFTGTCFWVDPDNQLIYIFLSNRVHPTRDNNKLSSLSIRSRIQDAIYKALIK
ncbi:MAG: glycoside hydrolase family 3 N-terminal domain-containing protein [Parabacteroides sp.]